MLSKRDEDILKAVHFYRYMTAEDVCYRLFKIGSLTYVRSILTLLAGGRDKAPNEYLYRFQLPAASPGNKERIFVLGSRGRDVLQNSLGIPVNWYYRPSRMGNLNYSHIVHSLLLTRFLVAAYVWSKQADFRLADTRISYELTGMTVDEGKVSVSRVIPDAWLLFEREGRKYPILLEIDRGTEYQVRFKQHISTRIEFIQSGDYERLVGQKAVVIAYITTGDNEHYRQARVKAMQAWTREVLSEQRRENWGRIFRFAEVSLDSIYETPLFARAVWVSPAADKPAFLLGG